MKTVIRFLPSLVAGSAIGAALHSDYTISCILLAVSVAVTNIRITVLEYKP